MVLPNEPGLQRRLAYGEIVRRRNRNSNRIVVNGIGNMSYEELIQLPTVQVGVTLKTLVERTRLYICYKDNNSDNNNIGNNMCVICQEETRPLLDIVRELQCMHTYHAKCIDRWLVDNQKCPLCNSS